MGRNDRRRQLIDLAADLVREGGLDSVTMENLAGAAGVNKTIVYRVFPNRSAALVALFERETAELGESVRLVLERNPSLVVVLPEVVRLFFDTVETTADLLLTMLDGPSADDAIASRRSAWRREANTSWAEMVASATGVAPEVAADAVSIVLGGLTAAAHRWRVEGRPRAAVEGQFVRIARAALRDLAEPVEDAP